MHFCNQPARSSSSDSFWSLSNTFSTFVFIMSTTCSKIIHQVSSVQRYLIYVVIDICSLYDSLHLLAPGFAVTFFELRSVVGFGGPPQWLHPPQVVGRRHRVQNQERPQQTCGVAGKQLILAISRVHLIQWKRVCVKDSSHSASREILSYVTRRLIMLRLRYSGKWCRVYMTPLTWKQ